MRELLESGRVQVFFDGLDEVFDPALREEVANVIRRFANDFPRVRIVVTSRVIGYKGESFRSADFRHFMLQELDDDQIATFLDRWHRNTYRSTETAEQDEKHARLTCAIAGSWPIRELAGNPLLLTMMAVLNRYRDLPRDRAELYEECSKLLLQQWKVEDALRADPDLAADALAIGLREKQDILRRLARAMQTGADGPLGNLIATDRLETIIEDAVKPLVKGNPRAVARALIRHLRERNFILCFAGGDSYAFVHRTFLDYFYADDLRVRFEHEKSIDEKYLKTQVFGPHWPDEKWHEILCLVAVMIHQSNLSNILEFILAQSDAEQTCQHIFLAARCVSEVRGGSNFSGIADIVKQHLAELVQFDLHHYYKPWGSDADRVSLIRTRAVTLRANVWLGDAETCAWLKTCAQTGKDSEVRQVAVQALARGWKDDPGTWHWLKTLVQTDKSVTVRQTAVQELAQGWEGDPDTLTILKICAQTDENGAVRWAAVKALAALDWENDPDILVILMRAKADENGAVRWIATMALSRDWENNPILQNDPYLLARRFRYPELFAKPTSSLRRI
ncbi:MAG: HEAT repeat domain-containing protein [Candidatus Competibacter sp.]